MNPVFITLVMYVKLIILINCTLSLFKKTSESLFPELTNISALAMHMSLDIRYKMITEYLTIDYAAGVGSPTICTHYNDNSSNRLFFFFFPVAARSCHTPQVVLRPCG